MKKLIAFILLAVFMTGCSGLTSQDNIINLLSAPQLSRDESDVVASVSEYLSRDVYLKYPKQNTDISPVQILDIDNDKKDEAVVIYSAPSISSNVRLAVLGESSDGWTVIHDSEGFGTDLYRLDFENLTQSKRKQIVVGYTFSDSSEKLLSVYFQGDENIENIMTYSCQAYVIKDITGNGTDDIILTGVNAENQHTTVQVISWQDDSFETVSTATLGTANARVTNIALTDGDYSDNPVILVDYYDTNRRVHTELFTFEENILECIIGRDSVVKKWDEQYNLISADVDGDKKTETPTIITDEIVNSRYLRFMEWTTYSDTTPQRKLFGICITEDAIFIPLPDSWQGLITPSDGEQTGEFVITEKAENSEIVNFKVIKTGISPKKLTENQRLISVGTIQLLFTFAEDVSAEDISHITEDIIYIK